MPLGIWNITANSVIPALIKSEYTSYVIKFISKVHKLHRSRRVFFFSIIKFFLTKKMERKCFWLRVATIFCEAFLRMLGPILKSNLLAGMDAQSRKPYLS